MGVTPPMQASNGQIQIESRYVIEALRQETSSLREHNLQLQAMFLQLQADAQNEIASLREQLKKHEEGPAVPADSEPSPAGE